MLQLFEHKHVLVMWDGWLCVCYCSVNYDSDTDHGSCVSGNTVYLRKKGIKSLHCPSVYESAHTFWLHLSHYLSCYLWDFSWPLYRVIFVFEKVCNTALRPEFEGQGHWSLTKPALRGQSVGRHGRNSLSHCLLVSLLRIKGEDIFTAFVFEYTLYHWMQYSQNVENFPLFPKFRLCLSCVTLTQQILFIYFQSLWLMVELGKRTDIW